MPLFWRQEHFCFIRLKGQEVFHLYLIVIFKFWWVKISIKEYMWDCFLVGKDRRHHWYVCNCLSVITKAN